MRRLNNCVTPLYNDFIYFYVRNLPISSILFVCTQYLVIRCYFAAIEEESKIIFLHIYDSCCFSFDRKSCHDTRRLLARC